MKIYVDFDDVLCETALSLIDLADCMFGRRIEFGDIHNFDLGISFGLTEEQTCRLMDRAHESECLLGMPPVTGAADVLACWHAAGHEVAIVTGRPPDTEAASREWLDRHDMSYAKMYFVDKYGRFGDDAHTSNVLAMDEIQRMGFALAVDDSPRMIEFLCEQLSVPVIVFDRPWNAAVDLATVKRSAKLFRCLNWEEIAACTSKV